jgi:NAD(P)-dependent dehydrogenase (short-subunit alcohol dehydrogenase family)
VQLPLYPFEHQRFWIERQPPSAKRTLLGIGALQRDDFADWFHAISWKRSSVPTLPPQPAAAACLVFQNDSEACARLVRRLGRAGCRVITVRDGEGAERIDASSWVINAGAPEDYDELIRQLAEAGSLPSTIVHAWGVTGSPDPAPDDRGVEAMQRVGFESLVWLAQAIGRIGMATPPRLVVVTDGVHEVVGGEPLVPEKATTLGPCRVIPQEFPNMVCRHVDLRIDEPAVHGEASFDGVVAEILSTKRDAVVAYRGGRRWVQMCEGMRLEPMAGASHPRIRQGGTCLITGGFGGVGLVLAEQLASTFRAKLILIGRRSLPPRAEWEALLARTPADPAAARVRAVQRLESLGAEVLVAAADVADESQMRAAIEAGRARFGRIDGVIHAAGVAGGGVIQVKKREMASAVLSPKVMGARVLARIFHEDPPEFLLLCSSMTSLVGGFGQVDYCGANAYLDAFARQFAGQTGAFAVSVNWNAWREVGMAVEMAVPENVRDEFRAAMLSTGLSNTQGVDAFLRILAGCPEPQVAISPNDLALLGFAAAMPDGQKLVAGPAAPGGADVRRGPVVTRHPRPALQTPYLAPRTDVERQICEIWQELLGIDRIGVHDNFFDLGGHSLLAIRVMARVNAAMQTNLPVARLYDGLTVEFLASLEGEHGDNTAERDEGTEDADRRRDRLRRQREQQARRREAMSRT